MTTRDKETVRVAEDEAARLMRIVSDLVRLSRTPMGRIGKEIGLGQSMVNKILNGKVRPQVGHLLAITRAIGMTPEDLFSFAYPRKRRSVSPLVRQFLEIEGAPSPEETEIMVTQEEVDRMAEAAIRRSLQWLVEEPGKPKR